MQEFLEDKRRELPRKITLLCQEKTNRVKALKYCNKFIEAATNEAAYGQEFSLFDKMRSTAITLPEEFEKLDDGGTLKGVDRRIIPYLRSQLFIALIAEIEDLIQQILLNVLIAYPNKIKEKNIKLDDLLESGSFEVVIEKAANEDLTKLFYAGPIEHRRRIEEVVSLEENDLNDLWPQYTEMKARRDVALHNNWRKNGIYELKIKKVGLDNVTDEFLGISDSYYSMALNLSLDFISILLQHGIKKFNYTKED